MPTVRSYGLPEVDAKPISAVYPNVPAAGDLASFGGAQARDLQQAGENLGRTADITFGIYERAAKEANELKVDSEMNKFVVEKQKLLVDFSQLKGEDAIKGASAVADSLVNAKKGLMAGAANDYQRNVLSRRLDAHLLDATGSVTSHVAKEAQAAKVQAKVSTLNNLNNQGVIDQNDPKAIDTQLGIVRDIATDLAKIAHGQSADPAIVKDLVGKAESQYITGILKSKIASGDMSAPGFYDKYKDKIAADARPALEQAIDTLKTGKDAQDYARRKGTDGAANASPDYITRVTGYEGGTANGGMIPNAQGSGAFGPGQFIQPTWNAVRTAHPELNLPADMTTATRAQHIAALNAFTIDNGAALQAAGLPVTPANLYLAHRFGAQGAEKVLKANATAPLASILPADWFTKNPDMGGQTAGSFIQLAQARMQGVTQIPGGTAAAPGADPNAPPVPDPAQGVPNVRQQLIAIEKIRKDALAEIEADYAASKIDDKTRRARTAAINTQHEQQKQGTELYKNQLWDAINKHMMTGGPNGGPALSMPDATLTSQLDPKDVIALQTLVDKNIAGKKPVTDFNLYTEVRDGLTSGSQEEREAWAAKHPMQWRPNLADAEFNKILDLRDAVRKGDPDSKITKAQDLGKRITERLGSIGVATGEKANATDRAKEIRFTEEAERRVAELEKSKGNKKATPEEISKILRDMTYEVQGSGPGWFGPGTAIIAPRKRAYEVPNADPAKFVVKIEDIPKSDLDKITAALKAENIKPTDEEIIRRYRIVRLGVKP